MSSTTVFQGPDSCGFHVVEKRELHAVIVPNGNHWFAQGLEIDCATAGDSLEDAKENFRSELAATVIEHLKVYGGIDGLLGVAPQELLDSPNLKCLFIVICEKDARPYVTVEYSNATG